MHLMFLSLILSALAAWAGPNAPTAWPRFRGPHGDGTTACQLPLTWSETNNIAWKTKIPGRGRSSPVLLGDRAWVTTALEQGVKRVKIGPDDMQGADHVSIGAVCVSATDGQILWHTTLYEVDNPTPLHWMNCWATPTPVIEGDRLYCDFGDFGTACLEAGTGKVLWKQRVALDHQVGPGSSPILWQNRLILVRDGRDAQFVCALDKATGEPVWRTNRPPIAIERNDMKKSFSTPLVLEAAGRTQLLASGAHWLVSYDPATGAEHWRVRHGEGFSIGSGPIFGHGLVFFSTGCFKAQLLAVRPDGLGDVTASNIVWKCPKLVPTMSSPVLSGGEIYWASDDGMATCADARTGEIRWQERLGEPHYASPLAAGDRIYFFGRDNKTTVVQAGTNWSKLAENKLEGYVAASPAPLDRALLLRTDTHLYRLGKR